MRAAVLEKYGSLALREVETPQASGDEVLVRVRASSLNAADWYEFSGRPYLARPVLGLRAGGRRLGADVAGVVEAVGADVDHVAPGDEVYGWGDGAFAELVLARAAVDRKPARLSFEEAAAVPIAGFTALQGLRDHGGLRDGMRVLVNGASGGVGHLAVQVAKALGAEVHAVCSTRNVEQAAALGADRVFDYTRDDFTRAREQYDVLFDNAGNRSWWAMRRTLLPRATVVLVGGPRRRRLLGPLGHVVRIKLAAIPGERTAVFFIAKPNRADLGVLRDLIDAGAVRPVVEQRFDLESLGEGLRLMGEGHARAKLVVVP